MITKSRIQFIRSLQQKKFRQMYSKFTVEGAKPVCELLLSHYEIDSIYAVEGWQPDITARVSVDTINESELERISGLTTPNQVLAVVNIPQHAAPNDLQNQPLTLLLDGINDPGNLGSIIRIADWFGVQHIFCSPDTVDAYNPKTVQAAMGSLFRVQLHYTALSDVLKQHPLIPCFAAVLEGQNVFESKLPAPALLLMGSEAHGIREDLLQLLQHRISIPGSGTAESLNVAVATGILCAEFFRRS